MALTRFHPFRDMVVFRDALNRVFDEPFTRGPEWLTTFAGIPAMNMYDRNGNLAIDIELPGMKPEEVDISIMGNTLTVKGQHKETDEVKEEEYYRHEVRYGATTRTVELPAYVDTDKAEATFDNGILKIVAPKLPEAQPKRIEVKS